MIRTAAIAGLLLAGCVATTPPAPVGPAVPPAAQDTCGASALGHLIGQPVTALERVYILRPMRIIRPGQAITMDFRQDRINFELDAADRLARIYCG